MKNVFIAGVQKSGTTALHTYIGGHSHVSPSMKKELHFFDDEKIDWQCPSYDRFLSEVGYFHGKINCDATPIYLYWPNSIWRLHNYDPKAQIIIVLRHPVFRAHSHWRMERMRGAEALPFSDAIRSGRARVKEAKNGAHRIYSYVERGFYAEQIKNLLTYYPRSQIHFTTTDQLWLEPKLTLSLIERFLKIPEELNCEPEYIISARTDSEDQIIKTDFAFLMEEFSTDICTTAEVTGLPLGNWLDEEYQEPVKDVK